MAVRFERGHHSVELVFEVVQQSIAACDLARVAVVLELAADLNEAGCPKVGPLGLQFVCRARHRAGIAGREGLACRLIELWCKVHEQLDHLLHEALGRGAVFGVAEAREFVQVDR